MKGQILDFCVPDNTGVISASDGCRYKFNGGDWRESGIPVRGIWVDFEASDGQALGVYRALGRPDLTRSSAGKSKAAATLWGIFGGGIGAHKFYMGSWGWGLVYLFTCWLYIPTIVAVVEWIHLIRMSDDEFRRRADAMEHAGPFGFFW
jgi:TM2 domain-containing membrane protein YozV